MAAATTILAGVSVAMGVAKGASDMKKGRDNERSAKAKLAGMNRQDLRSAYAGMSVPTEGFEMQRESAMQAQAEATSLLAQGGSATAAAGAIGVTGATQRTVADIGAQLREAQTNLKMMMAEDEARIRGMRERREEQDIAGLGAEIAYGREQRQAGISNLISTTSSLAELSMDTKWGDKKLVGGSAE